MVQCGRMWGLMLRGNSSGLWWVAGAGCACQDEGWSQVPCIFVISGKRKSVLSNDQQNPFFCDHYFPLHLLNFYSVLAGCDKESWQRHSSTSLMTVHSSNVNNCCDSVNPTFHHFTLKTLTQLSVKFNSMMFFLW